MKTPILLHIPEPCHENWDAMTPQDKGRHCQSCNKIVVDFSVMSDRQVLEYFKTVTGKTCGRFHDDQLQRPLVEPQTKPGRWNYFLASILGFIMTGKLAAQNRTTKGKVVGEPAVHRNILKGDTVEVKKDTIEVINIKPSTNQSKRHLTGGAKMITAEELNIKPLASFDQLFSGNINSSFINGKIVDEKNAAIGGATIKLKGTRLGVASDVNGSFEMKKLGENNKLTLIVSSIGFETKEIEVVPKDLKGDLNIVLKEKKNELGEVIVQSPETISCRKIAGGVSYVRRFRYKELAPLMIQKIFNRESIKIYPNPARKNDVIHITIKDAGEYALHFFDTQSRLLTVKNIATNTNNQSTEFQLPSTVATGTYFIRILNEKTQKQVTEKIIVQ